MNKKQLMAWHSWVGLKLSVLMFIVCFTGTLAVISHELDWLIDADMRVVPQTDEVDWDAMATELRKAYPQRQLSFIAAPLYSNFASVALTIDPELGARRTLVNPYTGEVLADKDWYASAQRVLRDLHRYLLSPIAGIYLVGPLAIILLISIVTALLFYKRWWQGFFKLRLHNGSRAFWGSLHKVAGLWSLWFILLIAITGVWYLVEAFVADVGINIQFNRPVVATEQLERHGFTQQWLAPSAAVETAGQQIPGLSVRSVSFPRNLKTPYYVVGQTDALLVRNRSNHVFIDPVSGDVLRKQVTAQQTAFERWIDMADPLHFGNFAGLPVKLIWFVFGALMCAMTATGIVIFIKRIKNRYDQTMVTAILGGFKYVTLLILLIPITMTTLKVLDVYGLMSRVEAQHSEVLEGDGFTVLLSYSAADDSNKRYVRYTPLCGVCLVNTHDAYLVLSGGTMHQFAQMEGGYRATTEVLLSQTEIENIQSIQFELPSGDTVIASRQPR